MLQRVEHVLGAVLDAVLVPGDETSGYAPVIEVLPCVVQQVRSAVQTLMDLLHDRAVVAEPDRAGEDEDVGREHRVEDLRPIVSGRAVFAHIRPHASCDVVVDGADDVDVQAVLTHDVGAGIDEALGVADLGRHLQGAVDEQGPETVEVRYCLGHRVPFTRCRPDQR